MSLQEFIKCLPQRTNADSIRLSSAVWKGLSARSAEQGRPDSALQRHQTQRHGRCGMLRWLHIAISNVKAFIHSAYHGLLVRYLDAFSFAFPAALSVPICFSGFLSGCCPFSGWLKGISMFP